MASSRKVPTNENISTYDSAGGKDYSSLSTWESATDNNLVTAAQGETLEVYGGPHNDTVSMSGATCNASYFRVIRPAAGNFHDGTPSVGAKLLVTSAADIVRIAEDYSQVQDLVLSYNINTSSNFEIVKLDDGADQNAAIGCIADDPQNAGSGLIRCFESQALTGDEQFFINCIAIGNSKVREGFELGDPGTLYAYNCNSIDSGGHGFEEDSGSIVCKNCLSTGSVNNDFHDITGGLNNASGDATAPGTSNRINQTFTFVNAAGDDYHLAAGDAGAKGYGINLTADIDYGFDDDIDFDTRSAPWDIGFDQVAAAGPANLGKINTILKANLGKINTVSLASILKINGVD